MAKGLTGLPLQRVDHTPRSAVTHARLQRLVLLAVFLAHAAGWVVLEYLARYQPSAIDPRAETSITVQFVSPPSTTLDAPTPLDSPPVREPAQASRAVTRTTTAADAGVAVQFLPRDPAPEPGLDARRLFSPDGSIRLPPDTAAEATDPFAPPAPVAREPQLTHQSTRFDRAWTPDGENLGQEIVRKFPPAMILLQGVHLPECPPDSNHPNCEATAREQRARIPPTPQSARQPW